jgi:uncharacterized protein YuzE
MINIKELAIQTFSICRPESKLIADYDKSGDVLYLNFLNSEPQEADYGRRFGDYILRIKGQAIVGVTILNAKEHFDKNFEDKPFFLAKQITLIVV